MFNLLRSMVLVPLLALAPLVEVVCGGPMLLGIAVSIAFELSSASSQFPFWRVIALSLGLGAFVIVYYAVVGLLSRWGDGHVDLAA